MKVNRMKLLMSDRPLPFVNFSNEAYRYVDLSSLKISNCVGCFGCWVKTPGKCVIRDDAAKVYPLIAKSESVIYVTHVKYGSYDTVMKTMLERAIPIQQAFIRLYHGETHHVQRAVKEKEAVILAYGDVSEEEKALFKRLVERNANNMLFRSYRICFVAETELEAAVKKEVAVWDAC